VFILNLNSNVINMLITRLFRFACRDKELTRPRQIISLIGPEVPQFSSAENAIRRIFDYCERQFAEGVVAPFITNDFSSVSQIRASACYLTSNRNRQFPSVQVPRLMDPERALASIVTNGRARFTIDNVVQYERIVVKPGSQ
jgi:hypothetical protein